MLGLGVVIVGWADGEGCAGRMFGTLGIRTTRLSAVQQIDAELPPVKLSWTRSDCLAADTGLLAVSATQSSKCSDPGVLVVVSSFTNANRLLSGDHAGLTTQSPLVTAASSVRVAGLATSMASMWASSRSSLDAVT